MSLFRPLGRITSRMSASFASALAAAGSALWNGGRPGLLFSTMIEDDAKALARGLHRRDPELLDRLIEQYQYRLFRYLVHLTGNRERAEDFFQETWVRVLERGHQYEGKWKFETWLFAIARNLVIDWHRRKKPASLNELMEPGEESAPFEPAAPEESPLVQAMQRQEESTVQASLARLPAIYREVLLLRFQEEMQLEEIAAVTSIPLSTVKSRLYRGLEGLRGVLQSGGAA
jgi:RNA polymerase sigma-70 factor (ECF subfamily)